MVALFLVAPWTLVIRSLDASICGLPGAADSYMANRQSRMRSLSLLIVEYLLALQLTG
jgi:hypothetical protein